ncbi:RNA 2',3'-cyclic phosphodiesterase [Nanoarchaeota archaeon]
MAVPLTEEVYQYVEALQSSIPLSTGRFSLTKQCHITLKFLGEDNDGAGVAESLEKVDFKAFNLATGELGFFPNKNNPRVFWLGLEELKELAALAEGVKQALPSFKEDHDFHAHITLARIKFLNDKQGFLKAVDAMEKKRIEFPVKSFLLMKSTLTPKGPVYEIVQEYRG